MALQRKDPIPPGRYWIDLFEPLAEGRPDAREVFRNWRDTVGKGKVRVEVTQQFDADSGGGKARDFVIFRVLEPVAWGIGPQVGFPEIIEIGEEVKPIEESDVKSSEDTERTPEDFEEEDEASGVGTAMKVLLIGAAAVGGVIGIALLAAWVEKRIASKALSTAVRAREILPSAAAGG